MRLGLVGARWGVACGASRAPERSGRWDWLAHAGAWRAALRARSVFCELMAVLSRQLVRQVPRL